jgi:hypothetical protein
MENEKFIESINDWSKFVGTDNLSAKLTGITKENVEEEILRWQKHIEILPPINYKNVFDEVDSWELGIPRDFSFETLAKTYARNCNYRLRIGKYISITKAWSLVCQEACDSIEDVAVAAFSGTAADKKAQAKYLILPFLHLKTEISRLENFLKEMNYTIIMISDKINHLVIEKQSQAKLNYKLLQDGESSFSTLDEVIEEDDEIFLPVTKKIAGK